MKSLLKWGVASGAVLVAACAGFRGGWESLPYVGEAPPAQPPEYRTPYEARVRSTLALEGVRVHVDLGNRLQTSDTQVVLYAVPVGIDPREQPAGLRQPGLTRVQLAIERQLAGFTFIPGQAVLRTSRGEARAARATHIGMWDERGRPLERDGTRGAREIDGELALADLGRRYVITLEFPLAPPDPRERDTVLDLSRALRSPQLRAPLPVIRFFPVRWQEGYT